MKIESKNIRKVEIGNKGIDKTLKILSIQLPTPNEPYFVIYFTDYLSLVTTEPVSIFFTNP